MTGTGNREPGSQQALAWDDLILVGVVARTHGIKGEVIVNAHTDFVDERFRVGTRFESRLANGTARQVEIAAARVHQRRPVIAIVGVSTVDEAEGFVGAELRIDPAEQGELPHGTYYHHQLIGCAVETAEGAAVGLVVAVEGETGQSRLVVEGPRRRVEIPLADEICTVDIAARRITVRPPDGLLELSV